MTLDDLDLFPPPDRPALGSSRRAPVALPDRQRINRRNKANGRRTSADLAAYLGGRNVELLGLPWDVEARGARIQSKREKTPLGFARAVRLLDYIGPGDHLAVLFWVGAGQRLTSGRTFALLADWVGEHGFTVPPEARVHNTGGRLLLELPLPVFRDHHIAEGNAA